MKTMLLILMLLASVAVAQEDTGPLARSKFYTVDGRLVGHTSGHYLYSDTGRELGFFRGNFLYDPVGREIGFVVYHCLYKSDTHEIIGYEKP